MPRFRNRIFDRGAYIKQDVTDQRRVQKPIEVVRKRRWIILFQLLDVRMLYVDSAVTLMLCYFLLHVQFPPTLLLYPLVQKKKFSNYNLITQVCKLHNIIHLYITFVCIDKEEFNSILVDSTNCWYNLHNTRIYYQRKLIIGMFKSGIQKMFSLNSALHNWY